MTKIRIESVEDGAIEFSLPSCWNELLEQFGAAKLMAAVTLTMQPASARDIRLAVLHLLVPDKDKKLAQELIGNPEHLLSLLSLLDFLFLENTTGEGPAIELNPTLTACPFPVLENMPSQIGTKMDLYAPANGLENITAYELALLFNGFEEYATTKQTTTIDKLIATMYRPSKPGTEENLLENWYGDRRQPLNEASIPARQEQIAKLPTMLKNVILFWLLSCRLHIIGQFPAVFQERGSGQQSGADYGWWEVFRSAAGNITAVENVARLNWRDVLSELDFLETQRLRAEMERTLKSKT
jgi:hypothetical protein